MKIPATCGFPIAAALAATSLISIVGCGRGGQTSVSGTLLRKNGTPLVGARVILRSTETSKTAYSSTDASGRFSIELPDDERETTASDYDVLIVEDAGIAENSRATIAAKYQDPKKSGLKVTVPPGQRAQFDATLDPP